MNILKNKNILLGAGAIMLAALLWSLDGVFIRPRLYHVDASVLVFLEHFLGFIILSPFIILNWNKIKFLRKKDWGAILWVSIFGGLIGTIMITKAFFAAISGEATFATVIILQKLQPVFALLMARLILGERFKKVFYVWAGIAIAAGYFLAFGRTGLNIGEINIANSVALFAIIAAFSFGSSTVFGKRVINHINFKVATALRFGLTSILGFILVLFTGKILLISNIESIQWKLLILIVFSSGAVAMFIYYYGLKKISASVATICELFWPLSAVMLDYIINKNTLSSIQIFSSIILIISFYGVISSKIKPISFKTSAVDGEGIGTKLGFPTINLKNIDLSIEHGVYLVDVRIDKKIYKALLHFGLKKTFSKKQSLELFLKQKINIENSGSINVEIVKKIRSVKKFNNHKELAEQIKRDVRLLD